MSKFKVGDAVFIAEGSQYYGPGDESNPPCGGKVISTIPGFDFDVDVEWDNGYTNCYHDKDLKLATERKVKAPTDSVTAWAVEFDGEINTLTVVPSRENARVHRDIALAGGYTKTPKKAVVRKVKIEVVKGR